jgi:MFS family permease
LHARPQIFSFIAVANFSAPIIGGFLYEKTGTIGVFVLAISLLTIDLGMRLLVIEKRIAEEYYAALPSSSEDGESTSDETEANDNEETPTETQPLLAGIREPDEYYILRPVSSKFLTNFPILRCLADPRLLTALFVTLIQALLFGAFDATIPIIGKSYFGFDSLKAGLLFVPLGSIELIAGPLFGWCVDHYGAKPVSVIGNIFLIPVFFCLRFPHAGGTDQVVLYALLLALGGAGLSAVGSPCIVEAGLVVDRFYEVNKDVFGSRSPYAQLYGMTNVVFSLGLTIGPELAGELKQIIGYGNMNALLAGICAIAGILSYLYMGGRPQAFARTKEVEDDV